jgi:hypothetical protein
MTTAAASTTPDWESAHHELVRLATKNAELEHALGAALLRALRAEVWRPMGIASFMEYAERVVGLTPRQLEERLRVARALEELPRMSEALAGGRVHFTAVRELSRVATPETEEAWLASAEGKTAGEIQKLVSCHHPGDLPDDPPDESARRHTVVLDLSAEAFALFRDARARLRKDSGEKLTDDEVVILMARAVLGGPEDAGRSSYQIQVTVCPRCGRTSQDGHGEEVVVDAVAGEMAQCDAQRMDDQGHVTQDIPPAKRRLVVRRQHGRCAVPGCRNVAFTDVHHLVRRADGGTHDPEWMVLVCAVHHRAAHGGALLIEGSWSAGLSFRHADGSAYGVPRDPASASTAADVHSALIRLGFKEKEVRWMVEEARPPEGAPPLEFEALFRRALAAWRTRTRPVPCSAPAAND